MDNNSQYTHQESKKLRNGYFMSSSRTYGEIYIEPLIRKLYGLNISKTDENDAEKNGVKYEIKASKVLIKKNKTKNKNYLDTVISECEKNDLFRIFPFNECGNHEYLSNIQNVKRDHFDILLYTLLFSDCLVIFKCQKEKISLLPNWCGKHGRYDQLGKSGQFPINKNNIQYHIDNHLESILTWDEVYKLAITI